jgi:hypothetical protein
MEPFFFLTFFYKLGTPEGFLSNVEVFHTICVTRL